MRPLRLLPPHGCLTRPLPLSRVLSRAARLLGLLCLACAALLVPFTTAQAATFYPGFKTLGVWQEEHNLRLDINVWYPSIRRPSEVTFGPWLMQVARNGREVEGRFPLIILSHDSMGSRFSHHETAALLARSGFVVAAPTHNGDNANDMPQLFTLRQIVDRVEELRATLNVLLKHGDIGHSIDPERVGVLGFGVGGTAALLLGGALPQPQGWDGYCAKAGPADTYCSAWAAPRMRELVRQLPLKKSLADQRVRAVAAVAPAYGMLFSPEATRYFYPPLLLVSAAGDQINLPALHVEHIRASMTAVPHFLSVPGVDAAAFMSACPPAMQKDIPDLCGSATPSQRRRAHRELNAALNQFFLDTLGDSHNLPNIPLPPDLTPPPPQLEIKEKPAPAKKEKARGRNTRRTSGATP